MAVLACPAQHVRQLRHRQHRDSQTVAGLPMRHPCQLGRERARHLGAWGISSVGELVATDAHRIRESLNLVAYGMFLADPGIDWEKADYYDNVDDKDADWDESSAPVLRGKKRGVLTSHRASGSTQGGAW
ncbi:hypothetical protein HYG77_35070 (plasmid) [Rhodococcus sp. ZPP]|uniref:hypothetical protein n=1 Tax=Rhodococcus sp. ZPP TaxID=2749906 RepID=UPI001AD88EBA|nr:hypothetical protein [Rhodococcus sp. ZPP]QTJ70687.1 hypothetical protein HYG77_35070 [Rhodococcus sp. ZPP]